jgi:hypothetical protein
MRSVRYLVVLVVLCGFSMSAFGLPRERDGDMHPIVKMVKRVVRALGDGLIVPTPAPKP